MKRLICWLAGHLASPPALADAVSAVDPLEREARMRALPCDRCGEPLRNVFADVEAGIRQRGERRQ